MGGGGPCAALPAPGSSPVASGYSGCPPGAPALLLALSLPPASPPLPPPPTPLQSIGDGAWQARPSVLATKVALLDAAGQAEQAASALASALQHWQSGEGEGAGGGCRRAVTVPRLLSAAP